MLFPQLFSYDYLHRPCSLSGRAHTVRPRDARTALEAEEIDVIGRSGGKYQTFPSNPPGALSIMCDIHQMTALRPKLGIRGRHVPRLIPTDWIGVR